jgi:hypothetical protein
MPLCFRLIFPEYQNDGTGGTSSGAAWRKDCLMSKSNHEEISAVFLRRPLTTIMIRYHWKNEDAA